MNWSAMKFSIGRLFLLCAIAVPPLACAVPGPTDAKVYGEGRIRVRPDQLVTYNQLVEDKGLPIFLDSGGRMVGWWQTIVGDVNEQMTLWEFGGMAGFGEAIDYLTSDQRFEEFVTLRDPLLVGEENRFWQLTGNATPPHIPTTSRFVVVETHVIPLHRQWAYLNWMETRGLALLTQHRFRPAGPWVVNAGDLSEITYLFRFDSLDKRESIREQFRDHPEGLHYSAVIRDFADEVRSRILTPAPFAEVDAATADAD